MTKHTDTSRSGDLVKMLRAGDLCGITLAADRIEALKAENERLRGALKMMVEHFATPASERSPESWWRTKRQVAQIARAALGTEQ